MKADGCHINLLWKGFNGVKRNDIFPADQDRFPIQAQCKKWCENNPDARITFWFDSRDIAISSIDLKTIQKELSENFPAIVTRDITQCSEYRRFTLDIGEEGVNILDNGLSSIEGLIQEDLLFNNLYDEDNYTVVDLFKIVVLLESLEENAECAIFSDVDIQPFSVEQHVLKDEDFKSVGMLCDHRLPEHKQTMLTESKLQLEKEQIQPNNAFLAFNKKGYPALLNWYRNAISTAYNESMNAYRSMRDSLGKNIPTINLGLSAPRIKE